MKRDGNTPMSRSGGNGPSREQLEAIRKEAEEGKRRVTQKEFHNMIHRTNRHLMGLSQRIEAMYMTMKRLHGEEFVEIFADSIERWHKWRDKEAEIKKLPLAEMRAAVKEWNSDPFNPLIGVNVYSDLKELVTLFGTANKDPMSVDERMEFLMELGFDEEIIPKIVGVITNPETDETTPPS